MKKVRHIIKQYPITIFTLLLLICNLSTIVSIDKVYATDNNNEDSNPCSCAPKHCKNNEELIKYSTICKMTSAEEGVIYGMPPCDCEWGYEIYVCDNKEDLFCDGTIKGCGGCETKCTEANCNPPCVTLSSCPNCSCEGCKLYRETRNGGKCPVEEYDGIEKCANGCTYSKIS